MSGTTERKTSKTLTLRPGEGITLTTWEEEITLRVTWIGAEGRRVKITVQARPETTVRPLKRARRNET